jgi:DNA-binding GntR family transcriptional regulator
MATTKAEEIAQMLEEAIVSGELSPGTVLRQEQLSEELNVSRTPIREALRELAALGLVTLEANRGARVRLVSREELLETFPIRAELEGLAAELAVTRMTSSQLKRLRNEERSFERATHALRAGSGNELETKWLTSEWVRANHAFHDVILEASGSPLLERMAKSVRRVFHGQIVWSDAPAVSALYDDNLAQHRAMREAFERRDASVRGLAHEHVLASGHLLDELLARANAQKTSILGRRAAARG